MYLRAHDWRGMHDGSQNRTADRQDESHLVETYWINASGHIPLRFQTVDTPVQRTMI